MDWNGSANGAMQSPKKKLHLKVKDHNPDDDDMKNAVTNVRRNLKSGKDISARNLETLMEHPRKPAQEEISYSSDYEEVVVIEEEPTDGYEPYVDSENGEEDIEEIEYEEEVIDEDGEEFEALPPPIKIPKALQHKDSDSEDDHEDDSSYTTASSDEEEEEDDPDVERKFSSWRNEAEEAEKKTKKAQKEEEEAEEKKRAKKMLEEDDEEEEDTFDAEPIHMTCPDDGKRPDKIRGYSYNPELPNPNKPMKKWTRPTPKTNDSVEKKATAPAPPSPQPAKKWTRPAAPRVVNAPKRAPSLNKLDADGRPDLAWTKPDWVSNGAKLRPTGKSAAANLAKPITNLPHMNKNYDDNNTTITTSNKTTNNTNNHDDVKPPAKQPAHASVLSTAPRSPSAAPTTKASKSPEAGQITKKTPVYPKSPAKAKKSAAVPPPAAVMKTPPKSPNTDITRKASLPKSPKSAPTAPRPSCPEPPAAELLDEDGNKVIEWEKPDWAQRRVLRSTSKTEALYAGKKIERPIGGIRPLEEEK